MDGEAPGPEQNEIQPTAETTDSTAEVVQGLRDRIEDPADLRKFVKEHKVNSEKGTGAGKIREEFEKKYDAWPGEEEEERQIKEYLSEGEEGKWQEKTLDRYRELHPEGAINPEKWKETVLLVRDELRYQRLEIYKDRVLYLEDDDKRVEGWRNLSNLQTPIYKRINNSLDVLEAREEVEGQVELEKISEEEGKRILSMVEIQGDPVSGPAGEQRLTKEILEQEGLHPRYKITSGGTNIWFTSSPYDRYGRSAVVAYIESGEKIMARTYYQSGSQGVWRYLPDYDSGWLGKGLEEQSITLPFPIQAALSKIPTENPQSLIIDDPELVFYGTAHRLSDREHALLGAYLHHSETDEDRLKWATDLQRTHPNDYVREISMLPKKLDGNFYTKNAKDKVPPEELVFSNPEDNPDFSNIKENFTMATKIYGDISVEVYPSKNNEFNFIFCRNKGGAVWIGGVEDNSALQSTGLRRSWVDAGDLVTPVGEYPQQSGGYGNSENRSGGYVDMWQNYLSKVPVIQEYLQAREQAEAERFADFPDVEN